MDSMSYRNNRQPQPRSEPEPQPKPAVAHHAQPTARTAHVQEAPKPKKKLWIVGALVALILLAAAGWYFFGKGTTSSAIDGGKYQAVFFTNGQVYFGKLSQLNGDYMRLTNVYYLQNKEQATDETSPQAATAQDASDVELIKLGNEIHGPEDEMVISKDQVLFFENLKSEGTVSETIGNFQKNKQ